MVDEPEMTIEEKFRLGYPIERALVKAVRHALTVHKKLGHTIAGWRDGKVVWIPPEEIPDYPEEESRNR